MDEQTRHDAMTHPVPSTPRGRCLVAGCSCSDVRIVSVRRAAFFADLAARRGETAGRVLAPEPGWELPARHAA